MDQVGIEDIKIVPLKIIPHPLGDIFHALKKSERGFCGFGEAYFSCIGQCKIKAWKKHSQMTLSLIVPVGTIRFVFYDDRENSLSKMQYFETVASRDNYVRLTIPPNIWMGFQGIDKENILLNIANMEHDPNEAENIDVDSIKYDW